MMKYFLAAAAAAAIAAPAAARDGSAYVGIEGGLLFPSETRITADDTALDETLSIKYRRGFDADLIAGYDFGMIRAEAELGWKRATVQSLVFDDEEFAADELDNRRADVQSLMGNVLLDLGGNDSWGAYVGGGFGRARVKIGELPRRGAWAWQLIAGARTAVSSNIDLGLKYRYFNTARLSWQDAEEDLDFGARGRFRSHSLLASLIFNFGRAASAPLLPPPPPPPPAAPAGPQTRTCPDGTVVLAIDPCPVPPPPPPSPMPLPERG